MLPGFPTTASVWHICPYNPYYSPSHTLGLIPILTLHFLYTQGTYSSLCLWPYSFPHVPMSKFWPYFEIRQRPSGGNTLKLLPPNLLLTCIHLLAGATTFSHISLGTSSHGLPPPSSLTSTSLHTAHQPTQVLSIKKKTKNLPLIPSQHCSHSPTTTFFNPPDQTAWPSPCPHLLFPHTPQPIALDSITPLHFCYFVKCIETYLCPK